METSKLQRRKAAAGFGRRAHFMASLALWLCLPPLIGHAEPPVLGIGEIKITSYKPYPTYPLLQWKEACELRWDSRPDTQYQLWRSTDLQNWSLSDVAYLGNGLPVRHVTSTVITNPNTGYYRLECSPLAVPVYGDYAVMSDGARILREIAGSGAPLVFVHGGRTRAARAWNPQTLYFSATRRTLRFDTRTFGRSDATGESPWDWTWAHTTRATMDLAELIDAFSAGPVDLCGLSMGSAIAAQYASLHPEKVRKLILASPWGGYTFPRDPAQMQLLEAVSARTVVIIGSTDSQSLNEYAYAKANGYTGSSTVVYGANHYVNESHPTEFNGIVGQMISGN